MSRHNDKPQQVAEPNNMEPLPINVEEEEG